MSMCLCAHIGVINFSTASQMERREANAQLTSTPPVPCFLVRLPQYDGGASPPVPCSFASR